jgi:hypothetical protein
LAERCERKITELESKMRAQKSDMEDQVEQISKKKKEL